VEVVHSSIACTAGKCVENDKRLLTNQANILSFESALSYVFTVRRLAKRGICRRRVSVCLSVCLSVCVSVCLSHSGIVSNG